MSFMDILKAETPNPIHEHVWRMFDELKSGKVIQIKKSELHKAHQFYLKYAEEYELPVEDNFFESEYFSVKLPHSDRSGHTKTITEAWFKEGGAYSLPLTQIQTQLNRVTSKGRPIIKKIEKRRIEIDGLIDVVMTAFDKDENGDLRVIDENKVEDFLDSPLVEPHRLGLNLAVGEDITVRNPEATARFLDRESEVEQVQRIIEELESELDNMGLVAKVIKYLMNAIQMPESRGATTEQSNLLKMTLRNWGKGGYEGSRNEIGKLRKIGFFKERRVNLIQQLLSHGEKGKLNRNIWELFVPMRASWKDGEWSDYIKYYGKNSKEIFYEILDKFGISTILPKQRSMATSKIKEFYATDLPSNIEKIKATMKSKKKEDYQYLFADDMVEINRNIIYKLSNHIMDSYEDAKRMKLTDSEKDEKTDEINELMNILEFMYQVMDITANLDTINEKELDEIRELRGRLKGRIVTIEFDDTKNFPMLQDAYDNFEDTEVETKKKPDGRTKEGKKIHSERERFAQYVKDVKNHFKNTAIGYEMEIKELREELKLGVDSEGKELTPQKKIGLRKAIKNRNDSIKELREVSEKETYSKRGPYSVLQMNATSEEITRDLRRMLRITRTTLRDEEKSKTKAKLEQRVKDILQMIDLFRQEEKPNVDTDTQRTVGDVE